MDSRISLIETPVTDIDTALVRVRIDSPHNTYSKSYALAIDSRMFKTLYAAANPPRDLEVMMAAASPQAHFRLIEWQKLQRDADDIIEMLARKIMWSLKQAMHDESTTSN